MKISQVVLILAFLLGARAAIDYCNLPGCNDKHIACRNNGHYGPECPPDVRMVNMTTHRDPILQMFNEVRNDVAGGRISEFPVANRMAQMKWSLELEFLAELNVRTCRNIFDKCRSTKMFPLAGQNIASYSYSGVDITYSDDEIIKERIEEWFEEHKYISADIIASFPAEATLPYVGDFTIAINEKNSDIGCAAIRFTKEFYNHFLLVCNFSVGNVIGKPVYTVGDKPASACRNRYGASYQYPNLCHAKEVYSYEVA